MLLKLKWVCADCGSNRITVFIDLEKRVQVEECEDCGALVVTE